MQLFTCGLKVRSEWLHWGAVPISKARLLRQHVCCTTAAINEQKHPLSIKQVSGRRQWCTSQSVVLPTLPIHAALLC